MLDKLYIHKYTYPLSGPSGFLVIQRVYLVVYKLLILIVLTDILYSRRAAANGTASLLEGMSCDNTKTPLHLCDCCCRQSGSVLHNRGMTSWLNDFFKKFLTFLNRMDLIKLCSLSLCSTNACLGRSKTFLLLF